MKTDINSLKLRISHLEEENSIFRKAFELLASNCSCSAAMRYSGHHVDCSVPHLKELLNPSEE